MASFTNAKTHVPECFQRKIDIDRQLSTNYDAYVSRSGNVVTVDFWTAFKGTRQELKIQQDLTRYSCAESIKRANGPE
jgi:hypothetical protein